MDHFTYKSGELYAEDVAIKDIAKAVGTPFYCYSTATLLRHYKVFADAFKDHPTLICFAVKANSNQAVIKTLADAGSGADCVSEGEIRRAIAAGIDPKKIVFAGVGKTSEELGYALEVGIGQFNVESEEELLMLQEVAASKGVQAPVAIRVNPDVAANSHDKISTGRKTDKFGISYELVPSVYETAAKLPNINPMAISTHIGSQLLELAPFEEAFKRIVDLVKQLREQGHTIRRIDLGGGLGIPYDDEAPPLPDAYADLVISIIKELGCQLVLEPGRLIAGNAGILVSKVVIKKVTPARSFLVIDAAMNDMARPAVYDAYHAIVPVEMKEENPTTNPVDVVGPVCETTDIFARERPMPEFLNADDLVAIRTSGAYGAVMSGTYNSRLLVPEVMVNGDQFAVIRKRPTYDDLIGLDNLADWQVS